jgi:Glycosyltransferase family 87
VAARLAGVAAAVAAVVIAATAATPLDYGSTTCRLLRHCDDAAPPIDALAHGHVGAFFDEQRLMGPVSEVVRAPFVALAGGGPLTHYRAGLVPCLLALAATGFLLARVAARRGWPWWGQLIVGIGTVVNPITFWAVHFGHPEELLGGVLVLAALFCACRGRAGFAGLLVGVAIATKLWALVAVPLLVVALPGRAGRLLAITAVTAGAMLAITALAAPADFRANTRELRKLGSEPGTASRTDVWFPLVQPAVMDTPVSVTPSGRVQKVPENVYRAPQIAGPLGHAAVILAALAAAFAVARRRGGADSAIWLALALVLLARCVADPGNRSYYHAPFLIALLAYEVQSRRALPWLTIVAAALFEAFTLLAGHIHGDRALGIAYCAWSLPLLAVIALELRRRLAAGEAPASVRSFGR